MTEWSDKLCRIFHPEAPAIKLPVSVTQPGRELHVKLYSVVKEMAGVRKTVAVGITLPEAAQFVRLARARMRKLRSPNDEGDPYFEMTRFKIVEGEANGH
jgi:hypothetical protein